MTTTSTLVIGPDRVTQPTAAPASAADLPRLHHVVQRTAVTLTVACLVPALLFTTTLMLSGISGAVVVALSWTCAAIGWRWATNRPPSWVLILSVSIMTVRTIFTLATGNTYVYFIQPVFADAVVACVFLASLVTARPMVARLAADFYPMASDIAARPRVRRLFYQLTLMWGIVIVAKGTVTLWLLLTQPLVDFVVIKNTAVISLTALAATATIWMSATVARDENLLATS